MSLPSDWAPRSGLRVEMPGAFLAREVGSLAAMEKQAETSELGGRSRGQPAARQWHFSVSFQGAQIASTSLLLFLVSVPMRRSASHTEEGAGVCFGLPPAPQARTLLLVSDFALTFSAFTTSACLLLRELSSGVHLLQETLLYSQKAQLSYSWFVITYLLLGLLDQYLTPLLDCKYYHTAGTRYLAHSRHSINTC